MSAKKCSPDCAKAKERRRLAFERSEHAQSYHRSGVLRSPMNSDHDINTSDATEYQSLPGRSSSPSRESRPSTEYINVESSPQTSEVSLDGSSMCLGGRDPPHHHNQSPKKDYNRQKRAPDSQREKLHPSDDPEINSKSAASEHRTHRGKKHNKERKTKCRNKDCSPRKSNFLFRKRQSSDSETQSRPSESESLRCPELCKRDPLRLPSPKTACESSCKKQAWLDKRREKRQAQVDKYILNKGLNYFEDLCHCSFKCLMTQICMDPFVKKTVASAAFFFLGMKLCFELDAWYIPF